MRQCPERDSNPRCRLERPESSTELDDRGGGCDGWGRTSIHRVTAGRPAVERRRIEMGAPARFERAHVGSKPTALIPLSYRAVQRRQQDSNLRAGDRLRASNALPCLARPCLRRRKERESNPQGPRTHPFSRRGTAPVAVLPDGDSGRVPTSASPGKSRELSLELRSHECGRQGSNLRRPAFQAGALPAELRPHEVGKAGLEPATSCL